MRFPKIDMARKLEQVTETVHQFLIERDLEILFCEDYIETELQTMDYWLSEYEIALQILDRLVSLNNVQFATSDDF